MTTLIIGLLIPLLGTMLGSAFVFFMRDEMSVRLQKTLLGFASGVMVAASVWSLLIPSMEMAEGNGRWTVMPAAVGFLAGIGFLLMIDEITPHLHIGTDKPEGMRSQEGKGIQLNRCGSMFTMFFNDKPVRNFQDTKRSDQERFACYFRNMLSRGIYVSPSQFEGNFISETHTPEILDYVLESIAESID